MCRNRWRYCIRTANHIYLESYRAWDFKLLWAVALHDPFLLDYPSFDCFRLEGRFLCLRRHDDLYGLPASHRCANLCRLADLLTGRAWPSNLMRLLDCICIIYFLGPFILSVILWRDYSCSLNEVGLFWSRLALSIDFLANDWGLACFNRSFWSYWYLWTIGRIFPMEKFLDVILVLLS